MVQNGKLAQSTCFFVSVRKSVDLPTFGSPTMPTDNIPQEYSRLGAQIKGRSGCVYKGLGSRDTSSCLRTQKTAGQE